MTRPFLSAALLLLAATAAFAQDPQPQPQQTTPPPAAPARPIHWPKIHESKLANGLTVVVVPLRNVPKVMTELVFLTGRGAQSKEHPGLAQLAARVANEGTKTRTSKELKEDLRSIGGSLSVATDVDTTTITGTALSEFTPRLLELMSDVAQHPAFPKAEVELAKTNFAQEIEEERSDPGFLATERLQKALFGATPYGFVVPDPKAIAAVTREQLVSFAAAQFIPNNAFLLLVGDIDPDGSPAIVQKHFGSWARGTVPAESWPALPKREKRQIYFIDRPGSVQSTIAVGVTAPPRKSSEYLPLRTADTIFGGSFYSRLNRNIREAKGYSYSPYSQVDLRRRAGTFAVRASVRNEVTGLTLLEMFYELDRIRVEPVTAEELTNAKVYTVGSMEVQVETQAGLAQRIATMYAYDQPRDFLQTLREKIDALTAEDIQHAAAKYFDTYRSAIVIVGDYAKVKDQVAPFGDVTLVKQ